jgi:hypothetical protein
MPPKASPLKAKAPGPTLEKTGSSAKDSADETGLPARKENKPPVEKKEVSGAKTVRSLRITPSTTLRRCHAVLSGLLAPETCSWTKKTGDRTLARPAQS